MGWIFLAVSVVGFLAYAFKGIGKFATDFLPFGLSANDYALILMAITTFYVVKGGMFSVVKVRKDQPAGNYQDPGWYAQPKNSAAYEWTGEPVQAPEAPKQMPAAHAAPAMEISVRKPTGHSGH